MKLDISGISWVLTLQGLLYYRVSQMVGFKPSSTSNTQCQYQEPIGHSMGGSMTFIGPKTRPISKNPAVIVEGRASGLLAPISPRDETRPQRSRRKIFVEPMQGPSIVPSVYKQARLSARPKRGRAQSRLNRGSRDEDDPLRRTDSSDSVEG